MKRKGRVPKGVTRVMALTEACVQPDDELVRVYLIEENEKPYAPGSIRRAGGAPIGVDERTRPRHNEAFMHHLLTLDLDEVPELRMIGAFTHARAVAVFISNADDHYAWDHSTKETSVLPLTEEDLTLGEWIGPEVADPAPQTFDLYPVDIPARAFYDVFAPDFDEDAVDRSLADLHNEMMSVGRIGGPVIHWSGDTYTKDFVLQCGEEVVDVNLGDAGTLYVFADTAYSQGH